MCEVSAFELAEFFFPFSKSLLVGRPTFIGWLVSFGLASFFQALNYGFLDAHWILKILSGCCQMLIFYTNIGFPNGDPLNTKRKRKFR